MSGAVALQERRLPLQIPLLIVAGHSSVADRGQAAGAEPPILMQAGRWSTPAMPARYTEARPQGGGIGASQEAEDRRTSP